LGTDFWAVIKCAKLYYTNPFRGYDVAEGQIVAFPIGMTE